MAFDITSIAQVYQTEDLNFSTDEERGIIRFSMNTQASPDVRFTARVVNPRTALFTTILPMKGSSAAADSLGSMLRCHLRTNRQSRCLLP